MRTIERTGQLKRGYKRMARGRVTFKSGVWRPESGGFPSDLPFVDAIDELHTRKVLDDLDYYRRSSRDAPAPEGEPLSQIAERESVYDTAQSPKNEQKKLFE